MKPNGRDETTKLHSCAVLRYMTKGVPKEISPSDMSTLTGLLSYLNLSNHTEDDLTSDFFVTGSASLGQIMDMTHYAESQQKLKLNFWRGLGYVDWTKRSDNNGCNYIVYATPQDDVKKKAAPDKELSERGKRGAEAARQKRSADLEGRNGERQGVAINSPEGQPIQTAGSADLDIQGQPNRKARSADSEATRPSRSATLELRSGTGSGTVDLELLTGNGGNQADKAQTTSDRSKSKTTPKPRSASSGLRPDPHREFTETPEPTRHPEGKAPLRGSGETSATAPRRTQAELDRILEERKKAVHRAAARLPRDPSSDGEKGYDDTCPRCGFLGEPCSLHGGKNRSFV